MAESPETQKSTAEAKAAAGAKSGRQAKQKKPDWLQRLIHLKPGVLRRLVVIIVLVLLFFGIGGGISRVWTNYLWYKEVGYTTVFWTPFLAKLCVGVFFAAVFFAIFYGSLWLARRISPRLLAVGKEEEDNVFEWPRGAAGPATSGWP